MGFYMSFIGMQSLTTQRQHYNNKTNKKNKQEKPGESQKILKLLTQTTQFLRDKRILPRSLSFINYSAHNPSQPLDSIP